MPEWLISLLSTLLGSGLGFLGAIKIDRIITNTKGIEERRSILGLTLGALKHNKELLVQMKNEITIPAIQFYSFDLPILEAVSSRLYDILNPEICRRIDYLRYE